MGKLSELAERAERATADEQRAILEEAWTAIYPLIPLPEHSPGAYWPPQRTRFKAMLDAEAYESAAMQLVPEGVGDGITATWNVEAWASHGVYPAHVRATAWVYGAPRTYAATPALAICASSLRARDGGEGL